MKFSNFFAQYFCSYEKIETITFLNSIIVKNRFLENYVYHFKIKKYVLNIFQRTTEKNIKREKIVLKNLKKIHRDYLYMVL